jgi:hypothetical protein
MGSSVKEDLQRIPSKYAPTAMFFMLIMRLLKKSFTDRTTTAALHVIQHVETSNQQPPASHSISIRSYYEL